MFRSPTWFQWTGIAAISCFQPSFFTKLFGDLSFYKETNVVKHVAIQYFMYSRTTNVIREFLGLFSNNLSYMRIFLLFSQTTTVVWEFPAIFLEQLKLFKNDHLFFSNWTLSFKITYVITCFPITPKEQPANCLNKTLGWLFFYHILSFSLTNLLA